MGTAQNPRRLLTEGRRQRGLVHLRMGSQLLGSRQPPSEIVLAVVKGLKLLGDAVEEHADIGRIETLPHGGETSPGDLVGSQRGRVDRGAMTILDSTRLCRPNRRRAVVQPDAPTRLSWRAVIGRSSENFEPRPG